MLQMTRQRQRGVGLLGLLFWGVVVAFFGVLAARVLPTVMEYYTIERAVSKVDAGLDTCESAVNNTVQESKAARESAQQARV